MNTALKNPPPRRKTAPTTMERTAYKTIDGGLFGDRPQETIYCRGGMCFGPPPRLSAERMEEIARWVLAQNRASGFVRDELEDLIDGRIGPDRISHHTFRELLYCDPYASCN